MRTPGVVEAPYGLRIGDLLDLAGGRATGLRAVLVGGWHGVWLPADALRVPLSRAGLQPWGGSPGAGVVVALPDDACGLAATARIVSYLAEQGAGQGGPCLNGLPRIAHALEALAHQGSAAAVTEIEWLTGLVEGRGACRHPDGTVRLVRSALATFVNGER